MNESDILKRRRVVVVGIPGVGKTTVVAKLLEILKRDGRNPNVVNYGSIMMELAVKAHNIKSRDEMRKLPIEAQRRLQLSAASHISEITDELVLVDTHLFISTSEGFWPGIPMDVLQALKPTNIILVTATPEDIMHRRQRDSTRSRDAASFESLRKELEAAVSYLYASSVIVGCPALVVENADGPVDPVATRIASAIN